MKNRTQAGLESGRLEREIALREGAGEEEVARFGEAVLVRWGGQMFLRGGSMADRMEALEWMAMFMPDAVARLKE